MSKQNNKTRILLSENNQLRKFFFIIPLKDGSFSFGSSLSKPQEMKLGEIKIPEGQQSGKTKVNFNDAVNVTPVGSHFTYHPPRDTDPAIVHLRSNTSEDRLFINSVEPLEDMIEFKRIFTIIPQAPNKLPIFQKKITSNDIIIPIDGFKNKPFSVEVFLCRKSYDYKKLLVKDASLVCLGICENKDYLLVIELYHKKEFKEWSRLTVVIPFVKGIL
ncbi:hypothetical protein [Desulfobacula sp.]|uniref:hypothetical protein n=1 Tax=Desulfobacula sp. TaxID=2593537 RepID=UPI0026330943|nr:hypothetical protein [Desulfobacula sp.]